MDVIFLSFNLFLSLFNICAHLEYIVSVLLTKRLIAFQQHGRKNSGKYATIAKQNKTQRSDRYKCNCLIERGMRNSSVRHILSRDTYYIYN